jgi:hypothetical protein
MGKPQKSHKTELGYKRDGMAFWGESILNFLFRIALGALIFWMLYYPIYSTQDEMPYLTQMSYIMLFTLIASLTALFASYIILLLLTRALRLPKKGIFELNRFPDLGSILYEMLAVLLNALFVATGMLIWLGDQTANWEQFFLLYICMKLFTRILALALSSIMAHNLLFVAGFIVIFFSIIAISVMEITGGSL